MLGLNHSQRRKVRSMRGGVKLKFTAAKFKARAVIIKASPAVHLHSASSEPRIKI
jgi:hypothetical protein